MLLERLMNQTGLSDSQLERFAATASKRYKVYQIPKRTGGFRTIEHPAKEIKAIQRWLNRVLIRRLPLHECATAYSKGSSIRGNAEKHVRYPFTLRVDFEEFFPSFFFEHVTYFLTESSEARIIGLSPKDICFASRIFCRLDALTIGAPSSPHLTNAMMYDFDSELSRWCVQREFVYSRYADDMFISSFRPNLLNSALEKIVELAQGYRFGALRINTEKTAFLSRRYHRSITGIVVTPTGELSIGRARKVRLKKEIYEFQRSRLPRDQWERVRGMLAFVNDVEPTFRETLI